MKKSTLKYKLMRGMLKTFARLPLGALYILSDIACFVLYKVLKYRVDVVRRNLNRAFPEKSEAQLLKIEREFYRHLCDIFVETAKLAHISDSEMARRVHVEGAALVNDAIDRGRSVVLMLGHYGNWEWITYAARSFRPEATMCEIYHPLRDKVMDRIMLELRSRFGTENIPMSRTIRRLLEYHREGRNFVCGFISDQRPFVDHPKYWTEFMGIGTPYVNGGEVIGAKLGAEFIYGEMRPVKRGYYKLVLSRLNPVDDGMDNPYTRAYMQALENSIRRNPPYWLWSHNRWKRSCTLQELAERTAASTTDN